MDKESKSISNLIKTKRYLIHTISLIIPYIAGIIFINAFSNYYHIRKCETFDESSLSLCLIINTHYILMINMVGVIFVISAIVLMIFKNYHQLNFIQINFMYLCFCTFLVSNYIIPELLILITASIFLLIYFICIKSKINISIFKIALPERSKSLENFIFGRVWASVNDRFDPAGKFLYINDFDHDSPPFPPSSIRRVSSRHLMNPLCNLL